MKLKLIVILLCFLSFSSIAQKTKVKVNHRHVFDIYTQTNFPLLTKLYISNNSYEKAFLDKSLTEASAIPNLGLRLGYSKAISEKVMIGIEFGKMNYRIGTPTQFYYVDNSSSYPQSVNIKHEQLRMGTFSILPKVEFSNKFALLPIGFSHTIGIGYTQCKIIKRDYNYTIDYSSYYGSATSTELQNYVESGSLLKYKTKRNELNFVYGFKVRIPINYHLLFYTGVLFSLNFGVGNSAIFSYNSTSWDINGSLSGSQYRFRSIANLNFGISYNL